MIEKSKFVIFVIEDNLIQQSLIKYTMELNPDHEVHVFGTATAALQKLHLHPNLVSLDYNLPDMEGEEVLKRIKKYNEEIRVVVVSAQKDVDIAVELLQEGADGYLSKTTQMRMRLWHIVESMKKSIQLEAENQQLKKELHGQQPELTVFSGLIGYSPAMKKVEQLIDKSSKTNIVVSITGETGTGKEVVAKSIHYKSDRKNASFIAVNMAAIPNSLIESELFGYEKGAFTGAETSRVGKFEQADGGTLFLDEIGDLDLTVQAKLLRALQEREITRIGGNQSIAFDVRIIVATHQNLIEEVQKGRFRDDLYYRLLGLSIALPPLRQRGNDILILAKHFLQQSADKNSLTPLSLSRKAKDALMQYHFPGNVRELKAMMELAIVVADGQKIKKTDIQFRDVQQYSGLLEDEMTMQEYCKLIIKNYLEKYNNDVPLVAKKLAIGRSTIYKWLKN